MNKYKMLGVAGAVLMMTSMAVKSDEGVSYGGIGYHLGTYEETGLPSASPTGLELKFGTYVSDRAAFEGRLVMGMGDDSINISGFDVDIELDRAISLFLKGDLPLSSTANLYGLIGFTKGKITASVPGFSFSVDDSGLSYGVGAEAELSNDVYVSGEYVFYLSEDTYDYSGFNLGLKKLF